MFEYKKKIELLGLNYPKAPIDTKLHNAIVLTQYPYKLWQHTPHTLYK